MFLGRSVSEFVTVFEIEEVYTHEEPVEEVWVTFANKDMLIYNISYGVMVGNKFMIKPAEYIDSFSLKVKHDSYWGVIHSSKINTDRNGVGRFMSNNREFRFKHTIRQHKSKVWGWAYAC